MPIVAIDPQVEKYRSVWLISQSPIPDAYRIGFRYFKNICMSLGRYDLIQQLDQRVLEEIERPLGVDLDTVQMIYKNMPYLNSYTRTQSAYIDELGTKIYKYQIKKRFETIMDWIFTQLVQLEPDIRFRAEKPIL